MTPIRKTSLFMLIVLLAGCAHYRVNDPKATYEPNAGYRYPDKSLTTEKDRLYVILALSGGGTRAAALSYGIMEKLKATRIKNGAECLLDEVDVISSVSGGSFTAAYYGLFGDRLFSDFKDEFLYRDIQKELARKLFNPVNWFRLMSPDFNRIDLAIELYDKTIFGQKTYQDLVDNGRQPFIAINATNMTLGSQFTFTQEAFDLLGSNLSTLPVARAVASSSAFPVLLSPVSYKNYPEPKGYALSRDITNALKGQYSGPDPRRYLWAYNQSIYQMDKSDHPYVHLMDGGLSDNIGVRYIADNFNYTSGFIFQRKTAIDELIVIIANAKTEPPETLDRHESPPDLLNVAFKTATVSMDNYSFDSVQMLNDILKASERQVQQIRDCQDEIDKHCNTEYQLKKLGHHFNVTVVEANFLNIKDTAKRQRLLSLPTSFSLKRQQVDELIQAGGELLDQSEAFRKLMARLR